MELPLCLEKKLFVKEESGLYKLETTYIVKCAGYSFFFQLSYSKGDNYLPKKNK